MHQQCLMSLIGDPHLRQVAGAVLPGKRQRIPICTNCPDIVT